MSKQKTAMQSLIKMLQIELAASEKYHSRSNALEMAIKLAMAQLPKEHQQIFEAYTKDRLKGIYNPTYEMTTKLFQEASDYFTDTYEQI